MNTRITSEGGQGGESKSGGNGGFGRGSGGSGAPGTSRRDSRGGHGGGAGSISGGTCSPGALSVSIRNPDNCNQGGPGQGSLLSGSCSGDKIVENGVEEGANGNLYGGGGSGGGCGKGGGNGADGVVQIQYNIEFQKYNKTDVMKAISATYWNERNRAVNAENMEFWYNKFKDEPTNYPDLNTLTSKIKSSIGSSPKASGVSDNCGGSYPKYT